MAHGQIKLRIFPDGRVKAEVDGVPGSGCMKFIPLIEELVGGEAVDSQRTANYYLDAEIGTQAEEIEAARVKGSR